MANRSECRKILFLLTDADGYNVTNMKFLQSIADREGIKIVAIGMGKTKVKECFRSAENVSNVSDLTSTAFNKLLKELK